MGWTLNDIYFKLYVSTYGHFQRLQQNSLSLSVIYFSICHDMYRMRIPDSIFTRWKHLCYVYSMTTHHKSWVHVICLASCICFVKNLKINRPQPLFDIVCRQNIKSTTNLILPQTSVTVTLFDENIILIVLYDTTCIQLGRMIFWGRDEYTERGL